MMKTESGAFARRAAQARRSLSEMRTAKFELDRMVDQSRDAISASLEALSEADDLLRGRPSARRSQRA